MPHSLKGGAVSPADAKGGGRDAPHLTVATKEGIRLLLLGDKIEALDESVEHVERAGEASKGGQKERDE